jgi:hypothetical protein
VLYGGPDGDPLEDLPVKRGKWYAAGNMLRDVDAAHAWGLRPSEFWASSRDDQAIMIARTLIRSEMAAWDSQIAARQRVAEQLETEARQHGANRP